MAFRFLLHFICGKKLQHSIFYAQVH